MRFLRAWTLVTLLVANASAQAPQPATAESSFREGLELARKGDCGGAIEKYKLSLAAKASVGASVNLGQCHLALDRPLSAYLAFEAAANFASLSSDPREGAARHRMRELYAQIPTFRIELPGSGQLAVSSIELDGKSVAPSEWWTPFVASPGDHRLTCKSSGGDLSATFSAAERGAGSVQVVKLEPMNRPVPVARVEPARGIALPQQVQQRSAVGDRVAAIMFLGGGALLITSLVISSPKSADGTPEKSAVKPALAAVGGVLAGVGALILIFSPNTYKTKGGNNPSVSVGPGTVSFSGRF